MSSTYFKIFIVGFVLSLTACATSAYRNGHVESTDFVDDYLALKEESADDAFLSYWKKQADWAGYKKIIVEPIVVKKNPGSKLHDFNHAKVAATAEILEEQLREALKQNFVLANRPGKDVLTVQLAFVDLETSTAVQNLFSPLYPATRILPELKRVSGNNKPVIGKTNIAGKILDSTSAELLVASLDTREPGKSFFIETTEWGDLGQSFKRWIVPLGYKLCLRQGRNDCQKPPDEKSPN